VGRLASAASGSEARSRRLPRGAGARAVKEQPGPSRATAVSDGPASAALVWIVLICMGSGSSE